LSFFSKKKVGLNQLAQPSPGVNQMPKPKIDLKLLDQMLRAGKTQREAAQVFGVSESAVSKAKKQLKTNIVRAVGLEKAHEVVHGHLDVLGQLRKINLAINEELDRAKGAVIEANGKDQLALQDVIIRLSSEIRRQLDSQMKIFELWYQARSVMEFQQIVLAAIEEVSPELKEKIIRRLQERRAVRSTVEFK
jgi:transcriptional regulator with XRE-family HTH domain